jgi:hypothetical protein
VDDDTARPAAGRFEQAAVTRSDAILLAGTAFGSVAILVAAALASMSGSLSPGVGLAALAAGAAAGFLAAREARRASTAPARWTRWEWLALGAFALVSVRQFGWLVFEREGALLTLLPHNYGDLPLHWTYIQHLASGASFWPENPILTRERLRYPLGVDLLTAVFVQLGVNLEITLRALGLAGAALAGLALRRWGGAFAVAGFLFAGGLAGVPALVTLRLVDVDAQVAWKNLFLALLVPQRGFLLALPVGLLLLWSWRAQLLRGEAAPLPAWLTGLLWGALPLVHLHTFAFVSLMGGLWAIATGRWRAAVPGLGMALLPAAWGVFQVTDGFRVAALVGWAPGFVIGDESPLVFLVRNFGFWLPLAVAALVVATRARRHEDLLVLVPSLGLFGLLFLVRLAPWVWDNTKVMLWCYVAVLPALHSLVVGRLRPALRVVGMVLLFASGLSSLLWGCFGRRPRLDVLDRAEYTAVCQALARVETSRVATAQTFNHPVALCGRAIVAGYAGHLWSHGLDAAAAEAGLKRLLRGEPGWQDEARVLGASHLFWGSREVWAFPASRRPWETLGPPVASGSWGALYRLN